MLDRRLKFRLGDRESHITITCRPPRHGETGEALRCRAVARISQSVCASESDFFEGQLREFLSGIGGIITSLKGKTCIKPTKVGCFEVAVEADKRGHILTKFKATGFRFRQPQNTSWSMCGEFTTYDDMYLTIFHGEDFLNVSD